MTRPCGFTTVISGLTQTGQEHRKSYEGAERTTGESRRRAVLPATDRGVRRSTYAKSRSPPVPHAPGRAHRGAVGSSAGTDEGETEDRHHDNRPDAGRRPLARDDRRAPFPFFLIPIAWFLLLAGIVVAVVIGRRRREDRVGLRAGEAVLAERFARGEIGPEDYAARLQVLRRR